MSKKAKSDGKRIVGGRVTKIEEYPWQISVSDENMTHICGGTILTRYVYPFLILGAVTI